MKLSKAIFKTFFLSLAIIANVHFAYAVDQSLIPPGKVTFSDQNGKPLSSGKVYFYNPSTTTPKTTYQDISGTIPNANPVVLDAAGRAITWGTGNYRQQVFDKNNNLIWDVTTSAAGSGSGGGSIATGDGDLVGTIKPWAGISAPNQYMFTYGQEVSRTTYSVLFTAITSTQSIFCTSGSATLTGLGDTTNFWIGMSVEVGCVSGGVSTVISKTSASVTLAANANLTENINAIFFPWGRGNGTTTFNLPDFRGLIPVGNNIMGGVASSNISDTYFGAKLAESSGAQGGSANGGSVALGLTNLPTGITSNGSITGIAVPASGHLPQSNVTMQEFDASISGGGAVRIPSNNPPNSGTIIDATSLAVSGTSTVTSNNTGSAGNAVAFSILPPSKTVNYIIKVTPDTNSSSASGVTSLGGMTGDIACGSGLTCTGNIISSTGGGGTPGSPTNSIQFNSGGVFTGNAGLTYTAGNALAIAPTTTTNNQALTITQTTPNSGSVAGPIFGSLLTFTDQAQTVTGTTIDANGQITNQTSAKRINHNVTGGLGNHFGLSIASNVTGSNGGTAPLVTGTYTNVGPITGDQWSVEAYCTIGPSGNLNQNCTSLEGQTVVATTGTVLNTAALSANIAGPGAPSGIFAGLVLSTIITTITGWTGTPAQFKDGILFSNSYYGSSQFPVATTGNIMRGDTGTVANLLNFHTTTFTGNIVDTPNVLITGSGIETLSGGQLEVTNASGGLALVNTSANTTSGTDGFSTQDSGTNNKLFSGVTEAAFNSTLFGVATAGNWGIVSTIGTTNVGLMVGTRSNAPLILGTNNTARMTFAAAGTATMTVPIAMGTNAITGLTTLASAGAMTFQSNGSTFAGNISTGQQWLIGTTAITPASNVQLTVSKNTGTPALGPISGTIADFINVDSTVTRLAIRSFGAGAAGTGVIYYAAGGTAASPTQTLSGNTIGVNFGFGYNAAGSAYATGAGSGFQMVATENFDNTHAGSDFEIVTTPTGSTTQAVVAKFWGSGGLSLATGAGSDPGANSFSAAGQVFVPNITQTSAAQTGTVCWTTGTGKFTVDTTVGCLTSIMTAKNITARLSSENALSIIDKLSPFAFKYKNGWGDSGHYEQFGLGAEEVAQVDERLVGRDPDGALQGVRYQELTAVLAGAIQNLDKRIKQLEKQ